jgi:hypothetical protein
MPVDVRNEVLTEVREVNGTAKQIAENIGLPESTVRSALKRLEAEGLVWSDNYQRRARVYGADEEGESMVIERIKDPEKPFDLGWPDEGDCKFCGARAVLLFCTWRSASYECRGTPPAGSKTVYGEDRCGRTFVVRA